MRFKSLKLNFDKLRLSIRKFRIKRKTKNLALEDYNNVEELFSDYYKNKVWQGGKGETVSGSGSTLKRTKILRDELPEMFEKYAVKTVFDAPCGDYNWFQHIERGPVKYIGGDIVKDLIEDNSKYIDKDTIFIHFDILNGEAPEADLWFCRDVLLHLSYDMIFEFLRNFSCSKIPWLLVSNYGTCSENIDIPTGAGRPVNLEIEPFNFPAPEYCVNDDIDSNRPKPMGLWRRETIADIVLGKENSRYAQSISKE